MVSSVFALSEVSSAAGAAPASGSLEFSIASGADSASFAASSFASASAASFASAAASATVV